MSTLRSRTLRLATPFLDGRPGLRALLRGADQGLARWQHALARRFPALIRPEPRQLTIAVTAACNLTCAGCRYGRDFMPGARLELSMVRDLLEDARAAGVHRVRFYGGEPLLHPDLPAMIAHASALGLEPYVTTNALLLGERVDELVASGLAWASMGFYGTGTAYDAYTGKHGRFERLERSLARVRERHPRLPLQLNWTVLRTTCDLDALAEAWAFAERFDLLFHLDLYMHRNPFFTDGPDGALAFRAADRPRAEAVARELVRLKRSRPERLVHSLAFLRSVPDWLILGPSMRVPCDAYQLLWVGADGTVQLCDVAFPLGNLHRERLRSLLYGDAHRRAARDGFRLRCPNCTCKAESRITKHGPSRRRYGTDAPPS